MIDIFNINLLDIMPESLKNDPDVQALCDAITPEIREISADIAQCIILARANKLSGWDDGIFQDETYSLDDTFTWDDTVDGEELINYLFDTTLLIAFYDLPEEVLDLLAWQLHVDFYDSTLPVETKRVLVGKSIRWHKQKGTPAAVEELITTVFGDGVVLEWFEYGGQPYHFKVLTTNTSATTTDVQRFTKAVKSVKNTRSILEAIEITATDEMNLYFGSLVHIADYQEIRQVV